MGELPAMLHTAAPDLLAEEGDSTKLAGEHSMHVPSAACCAAHERLAIHCSLVLGKLPHASCNWLLTH